MKLHSCQPCAKRKVRCDREQPCSNCKRRRVDTCTYAPALSPGDRIRYLEALVRDLGGDPDADGPIYILPGQQTLSPIGSGSARSSAAPSTASKWQGNDPYLVKEGGESVYVESGAWFAWNGKSISSEHKRPERASRVPGLPRSEGAAAFMSILRPDPSLDPAQHHPSPKDAATLWFAFFRDVDPLLKLCVKSELEGLCSRTNSSSPQFSDQEHSLVFSIYLVTVFSLSESECQRQLHRDRADLLSEYQIFCEQALARSDFLGASDMTTLQALALYIVAGSYRLSSKNLWGLMGVAIRGAERLGLHRDGTFLGLTPYETERRRRLWWQLQLHDLFLAVWAGSSSLTLHAEWDTKLPLNIEDRDLSVDAEFFPAEREGLTDMSYCLWRYYTLQQQRLFVRPDGSPVGFSWASDRSLPHASKQAWIDQLEAGLKTKFLQHCDPIRPLDLLIQISARACICTLRKLTLHPLAYNGWKESRQELLDASIKCLEYCIALQTTECLQRFGLRKKEFFDWSAFIHVLSEVTKRRDSTEAADMWDLLIDTYAANPSLTDLTDDPRKLHAAELMVSAWKAAHENEPSRRRRPANSTVMATLESRLADAKKPEVRPTQREDELGKKRKAASDEDLPSSAVADMADAQGIDSGPIGFAAELSLEDIDWSFWLGFDQAD